MHKKESETFTEKLYELQDLGLINNPQTAIKNDTNQPISQVNHPQNDYIVIINESGDMQYDKFQNVSNGDCDGEITFNNKQTINHHTQDMQQHKVEINQTLNQQQSQQRVQQLQQTDQLTSQTDSQKQTLKSKNTSKLGFSQSQQHLLMNMNHQQQQHQYQNKVSQLRQNYKGQFGAQRLKNYQTTTTTSTSNINQTQQHDLAIDKKSNINVRATPYFTVPEIANNDNNEVDIQNNNCNDQQQKYFPARTSFNMLQRYGYLLDNAKTMMKQRSHKTNLNNEMSNSANIPLKNESILNQSRLSQQQYQSSSQNYQTCQQDNGVNISNDDLKHKLPKINDGFIPKTHASISFRRTLPVFRQHFKDNTLGRSESDFKLNILQRQNQQNGIMEQQSLKQLRITQGSNFLKPLKMSQSHTQLMNIPNQNTIQAQRNFNLAPIQPKTFFQTELYRPDLSMYQQQFNQVQNLQSSNNETMYSNNNLDQSDHMVKQQPKLTVELIESIKHKLPIQKQTSRAAYKHTNGKYGPVFKYKSLRPSQSLDTLHRHYINHQQRNILVNDQSLQTQLDTSQALFNDKSIMMNTSNSGMDIYQTIMNVKNEHLINANTQKLKKDLLNTIRNYDERLISFKKAQRQLQKITVDFMNPHYQKQDNSRLKVFPIWNRRGECTNADNILDMSFNSIFSKQFVY